MRSSWGVVVVVVFSFGGVVRGWGWGLAFAAAAAAAEEEECGGEEEEKGGDDDDRLW